MNMDISKGLDTVKKGLDQIGDATEEFFDNTKKSASEFHDKYTSKVIPKDGIYKDMANFAADMTPVVGTVKAFKEGDVIGGTVSAGFDIGTIAGAGLLAKAGGKVVVGVGKQILKKGASELVEQGAKTVVKEGAETVIKEGTESVTKKATKELAEEVSEGGVKKIAEEGIQDGIKLSMKERYAQVLAETKKSANTICEKTGVRYDDKGFPIFDAKARIKLKPEFFEKSREIHKKFAIKELNEQILKNPDVAKKFTQEEMSLFKAGKTPENYVWHHHQESGVLELVDKAIHSNTPHIGGFKIWGKN